MSDFPGRGSCLDTLGYLKFLTRPPGSRCLMQPRVYRGSWNGYSSKWSVPPLFGPLGKYWQHVSQSDQELFDFAIRNGFGIHPLLVPTNRIGKVYLGFTPATPYTFTSPGKETLHGGAQITTQCTKHISRSLSVGMGGWIEKKRHSEACIFTVTCLRTHGT